MTNKEIKELTRRFKYILYKKYKYTLNNINSITLDDLVQEALLRCVEVENKYDRKKNSSKKSYLMYMGMRHVQKYMRRNSGIVTTPSADNGYMNKFISFIYPESFEEILGTYEFNDEELLYDFIDFIIAQSVEILGRQDADILISRFGLLDEPMTERELAAANSTSQTTINRRIKRSIIRLRNNKHIQEYYDRAPTKSESNGSWATAWSV